jgi:hypothetical protein
VRGFPVATRGQVQGLVSSAIEVLQFKMLSVNQVYAALEGVVYVTNREGKLIGRGEPNWSDFAIKNSAPELSGAKELNCYSAFSGEDTHELYKRIYEALWTRKLAKHSSAFRCDSPSRRREYRLTLTPLISENEVIGILHQSLPISETLRPPLDIFNPEYRRAFFDGPLVRICSYCLCIWDETGGSWIEAEHYYQKGGSSQVQLTHGVCSICKEKGLAPIEQRTEFQSALSD